MSKGCVLLRGGGDLASGTAYALHSKGLPVVILEIPTPLCVRRTVCFAQAVVDGKIEIEGVTAVRVHDVQQLAAALEKKQIPVWVSPFSEAVAALHPKVVVDATMAKKNAGMTMDLAELTIGLGPGFCAGIDVDVVVETNRGHQLGNLIYQGPAQANTGIPGSVMGYDVQRVLRAPCDGVIRNSLDIGAHVKTGEVICHVDTVAVKSPFDGIVRGLIMNLSRVSEGLKIGDVDPRGKKEYCYTFSDKALMVGCAVEKAIRVFMKGFV